MQLIQRSNGSSGTYTTHFAAVTTATAQDNATDYTLSSSAGAIASAASRFRSCTD